MKRVLNVMLSRTLGGIQQSFIDYNKCLKLKSYEVNAVISTNALIESQLECNYYKLSNYFSFDPISILQLIKLINQLQPDIVITHGNRAAAFTLAARTFCRKKITVIAVAHNYSYKTIIKCDYIIALTNHLKNFLIDQNFSAKHILMLPNMIDSASYPVSCALNSKPNFMVPVPVIGVMARFVAKKGVDDFLKALAILKQRNKKFTALIGGEGKEQAQLLALTEQLGLTSQVKFTGWIADKIAFFNQIDIFCLPSKEEPFGIIILEAMLAGKAIVSTNSAGPAEILTHRNTALLCRVSAPLDMADQLENLIDDSSLRARLAQNAHLQAASNYDIKVVSELLSQYLTAI